MDVLFVLNYSAYLITIFTALTVILLNNGLSLKQKNNE